MGFETMIALDEKVFKVRRSALMVQMSPHSIAILPASSEQIRNNDVHHAFRQDSDFWYLTGFQEPDALAVFVPNRAEGEFILFVPPKDPVKEIWEGYRAGVEGALCDYQADEAHDLSAIDRVLPALFEGCESIYFTLGLSEDWDVRMMGWLKGLRAKVRSGVTAPERIEFLAPLLHEMRLFKSPAELQMLRRAAAISVEGHKAAMSAAKTAHYEFEIQAALEGRFKQLGSERVAFNSIVAAGHNACVLHYTENRAALRDSDLILVDAGAEYGGYAGDITHCFPRSGKFSAAQAAIYSLVLEAQQAGIAACQVGQPYDAPHQAVLQVLAKGLIALGLLTGTVDEVLSSRSYERFFMHKTGHWLGMDVHDVGTYKQQGQWRRFKAGMVLTVEPGLYIPDEPDVPSEYRGIGVRIEDDVLITAQGPEVLTQGLPRTVDAIETWMTED